MPLTELEARLRPIARERIAHNSLPCEAANRMWGGKGSGKPCSLCDEPITPDQVEYEVEHPDCERGTKVLRFHILCQSIWLLECARGDHLRQHPP